MKRILTGLLVLAALVLAPAAPAVAAEPLVVQVRASQVTLNADGTVSVPVRARCYPPLYAFEFGVGVRQGDTVGGVSTLSGPFPACTGRWERTTLTVAAEIGTTLAFRPGAATVSVYVAAYDPVGDHDVYGEDSVTVRLR